MNNIIVPHTIAYGKKWIFEPYGLTLQCAYCIFVQSLIPVRDDTGLVIELKMDKDNESHRDDCPQANSK